MRRLARRGAIVSAARQPAPGTSTGTIGQTLPALTQDVSGTSVPDVTGTIGQTLPVLSQTATGTSAAPSEGLSLVGHTALYSNLTTTTVAVPAGTAEGDLMVKMFAVAREPATTAGWTRRRYVATGTTNLHAHLAIYTRVAGASEPASYDWTSTASSALQGSIVCVTFRDADLDETAANQNSSSSFVTPDLGGTSGGLLLACFSGREVDFGADPLPSGLTELVRLRDGIAGMGPVLVATESLSATGAVGTRTATVASAWGRVCNGAITIKPKAV